MNILNHIQMNYNEMTPVQRKISDLIIKNYDALIFMTLEEMAEMVNVSTTSVIRFTRMLGFEGYSGFQQALREETMNKESMPERLRRGKKKGGGNSRLKEHLENTVENLNITAEHLENADVLKSAEMIAKAKRVFIYGTCSMECAAHYLRSTLCMLHSSVYQLRGTGGIYAEDFMSLKEGDVCVLFIFPRYEFLLLKLLPVLKERKVKTIIFTSLAYDTIADCGDAFIPCRLKGVSIRDSLTPILFAVDYLADEVAGIIDYKKKEELAESMEELVVKFYCGL